MLHPRSLPTACFVALLVAPGCDFFTPPDPTPGPDLALSCGETLLVDDLAGAQEWDVDASAGSSIEITTAFGDPGDSVRLVYEDAGGPQRATGFTDPVTDRRLVTGFVTEGFDYSLQFLFESDAPTGSVTMTCSSPGEHCGNLADDDGDGAIDCADTHCARDPGCLDGQRDFDLSTAACTDEWEPLETPELRSFSSQRTIYRLLDDEGEARDEFWAGGETVIISSVRDRFVQIRSLSGGLACVLGSDLTTHIFCEEAVRLGSDIPFVVADADLPIYLEPLGPAWTDLEVRVDCGTDD